MAILTQNKSDLPELYYTAQEVATILKYQKPDRVYLLVRSGILKGFKRGRRWLIDKEEFDRWRKAQVGILIPSHYQK